jgi:hypothetical protein
MLAHRCHRGCGLSDEPARFVDQMNLSASLGEGGGPFEAYVSLVRLLTAASPVASIIDASGDVLGAGLVAPDIEWRSGCLTLDFPQGDAPDRVSQALLVWTVSARVPPGLWPSPVPPVAMGNFLYVSLHCSSLELVAPQRFRVRRAVVQGNLGGIATADLSRIVQGLLLCGDDAQRIAAGVFGAWQRYAVSAQ